MEETATGLGDPGVPGGPEDPVAVVGLGYVGTSLAALLSEKLGTDAIEVIKATNRLPKGQHDVNVLYPGARAGGSCRHKDPWFVARLGDEYGLDLETPLASRRANDRTPGYVVERLREAGADVRTTDSSVPADEREELLGVAPERLPETLDGADAVVIVTDHDAYRALPPETLRERVGRHVPRRGAWCP